MKRLLLVLMLLAAQACAYERLAIIKPIAMPGSLSLNEYSLAERDLRGALDLLGVDYDFLPQNVVQSDSLPSDQDLDRATGNGSIKTGGITRSYGAAVHFWWGAAFTKAWGYNPDSLTRQAAWPTKPQLFIGPPTIIGSTQWSFSSSCSTGIGAGSGPVPFGDGEGSQTQANGRAASAYLAGSNLVWKNWTATYKLGMADVSGWPGITRGLIGTKTVLGGGQYETCNQCDGGTRSDPPDSVSMWYRQRSTGAGVGYGSRLIFVWPAAQGGSNGAIMQYVMALCALDSSAGGTLIGAAPGWTPRKLAIFIDKAAYHSSYAATGSDNDHGLFVGDTTSTWAHVDSLDALGVPYTIAVNADRDTLAAYPYEVSRLKRLVNARFAPQVLRGVYSVTAGVANSTARNRVDVFGTGRTRQLYEAQLPYTPTTTDSSLYAGIWYARALVDSVFPGRTSRSIYPPAGDWVANQHTRSNLPDKYELAKTLWYAGVRTLVIDPDNPNMNPNPSFSVATGSTYAGVSTNIAGLFAAERRVSVYADSVNVTLGGVGGSRSRTQLPLGSINFAAARLMRSESSALNLSLTHNYTEEFFWGFVTQNWYRTDIAYYYHYFHTSLSVFHVSLGYFGGDGTGNNQAAGWWQVKHVVNQVKACNKLAGRTVIQIVDAGDL